MLPKILRVEGYPLLAETHLVVIEENEYGVVQARFRKGCLEERLIPNEMPSNGDIDDILAADQMKMWKEVAEHLFYLAPIGSEQIDAGTALKAFKEWRDIWEDKQDDKWIIENLLQNEERNRAKYDSLAKISIP